MSDKIELRNQRRKEAVEAIVVRQEPVHLVARIFLFHKGQLLTGCPCIVRVVGMRSRKAIAPGDREKCRQTI